MGESRCVWPRGFDSVPTLTEPRQELLHWLNSLLQLNVTKVEQCGTGYANSNLRPTTLLIGYSAALCQIFDSIYRMFFRAQHKSLADRNRSGHPNEQSQV